MGKAGRWLRNFFLPGRKGRKAKDRADTDCQSVLSAPLPAPEAATPSVREKRRWSFRRPGAAAAASGSQVPQGPLASSSSHCFSEAEVRVVVAQDDHHAVAEVPTTSAPPVASLLPPASGRIGGGVAGGEEDAAAIRIQSAFRSYLARKALCALRGMVRLQAMVRGQLVRRQADVTLRRMQALVDAQRLARAERLRLLLLDDADGDDDDARRRRHLAAANAAPRWAPPSRRRSPQHHPRSRKPPPPARAAPAAERGSESEDNVRIVEVDDGGVAPEGGRRSSSFGYYAATPGRTPPAMAELCQKISPTPSALTDASAGTLSGRLDDASFTSSAACESSRRVGAAAAWRADHHAPPTPFPSYMANTESSRAKARSQSAPRQRPSSASDTSAAAAAASPSPSCCEPRPSSRGGGADSARRRASLDPLDLPSGAPRSSAGRMERCASRAMAMARAGAVSSLHGSECGSSSTAGHRGSVHAPWQG